MKKGVNNRYNKKVCKKVVRSVKKKDSNIRPAVISTGCCGMKFIGDDGDPW